MAKTYKGTDLEKEFGISRQALYHYRCGGKSIKKKLSAGGKERTYIYETKPLLTNGEDFSFNPENGELLYNESARKKIKKFRSAGKQRRRGRSKL